VNTFSELLQKRFLLWVLNVGSGFYCHKYFRFQSTSVLSAKLVCWIMSQTAATMLRLKDFKMAAILMFNLRLRKVKVIHLLALRPWTLVISFVKIGIVHLSYAVCHSRLHFLVIWPNFGFNLELWTLTLSSRSRLVLASYFCDCDYLWILNMRLISWKLDVCSSRSPFR